MRCSLPCPSLLDRMNQELEDLVLGVYGLKVSEMAATIDSLVAAGSERRNEHSVSHPSGLPLLFVGSKLYRRRAATSIRVSAFPSMLQLFSSIQDARSNRAGLGVGRVHRYPAASERVEEGA